MAMTYEQEQQLVTAVIGEFTDDHGSEFGLRAFPGKRFRINADKSFYSDHAGGVQLVVQVYDPRSTEVWLDFGREPLTTLRSEVVALMRTCTHSSCTTRTADPSGLCEGHRLTAAVNPHAIALKAVDPDLGTVTVAVHDFDDVKKLQRHVIQYAGHTYTFTGWNSDKNEAYFKWSRQWGVLNTSGR